MNNSELLDIRDDAVLDRIANESVSLSLNAKKKIFLKSIINRLKDLESLLMDTNLEANKNEIINLINNFDSYDISNYNIDQSKSTFLHLVVNKPFDKKFNSIQIEIFTRLLEKECDLNGQDIYGFTVLHYCCNYNLIEIAKLIINHKTFKQETINLKTTRQLKLEKFYFLIGSNPIQICSWLNHFELGELLVNYGANIHDKNESGWSCIHICSRQNYIEFVNFLIEKNCNVNDINDNLKTPLMVAARHGHSKLARALLNANADVASRNKYGQSPLYVGKSNPLFLYKN
jgi:ankyrin repeat protein